MSQRQIASAVGCALQTVNSWVRKFKEAEAQGVSLNVAVVDKARSGAPPKITDKIAKAILQFTEGKVNRQAHAIKAHVKSKFGVLLHAGYISEWLNEQGLHPYHRSKNYPLTDAQKQKRVRFARKYRNQNWMNTVFTDESEFPLVPSATNTKNNIVWARCPEDVPAAHIDQFSPSVRVWGGVSAKGKTRLFFYTGDLNAVKYRDKILKKAKQDFKDVFGARNGDWTFLHDGASCHSAKSTNEWLENNVPNHITSGAHGDFPAKSPDLNAPIEHVWGYMKDKLEYKRPTTIPAMKTRLKRLWNEYDQNAVAKQAAYMPNGSSASFPPGGEWTKG
jgi:transposase